MFSQLHAALANSALMFFLVLAIWSFVVYVGKKELGPSFWGALAVGELLIIAQGAIGAFLWFMNLRPERGGFHVLYGIVAVLIIPGVFTYTKGGGTRREAAVYAAALLFGAGILLRGMTTG